jgi:hypothetical protein
LDATAWAKEAEDTGVIPTGEEEKEVRASSARKPLSLLPSLLRDSVLSSAVLPLLRGELLSSECGGTAQTNAYVQLVAAVHMLCFGAVGTKLAMRCPEQLARFFRVAVSVPVWVNPAPVRGSLSPLSNVPTLLSELLGFVVNLALSTADNARGYLVWDGVADDAKDASLLPNKKKEKTRQRRVRRGQSAVEEADSVEREAAERADKIQRRRTAEFYFVALMRFMRNLLPEAAWPAYAAGEERVRAEFESVTAIAGASCWGASEGDVEQKTASSTFGDVLVHRATPTAPLPATAREALAQAVLSAVVALGNGSMKDQKLTEAELLCAPPTGRRPRAAAAGAAGAPAPPSGVTHRQKWRAEPKQLLAVIATSPAVPSIVQNAARMQATWRVAAASPAAPAKEALSLWD